MAYTITIMNQKGGVGKTTISLGIYNELERLGHKTLLVDLDEQANATKGTTRDYNGTNALDLFKGTPIGDVIHVTEKGHHIIYGTGAMSTVETEVKGMAKEQRLRKALEQVQKDYDYIIIDTSPTVGLATINALVSADGVIIPTHTQYFSTDSILSVNESIKDVRMYYNPDIICLGIAINQYNARLSTSKQLVPVIEQMAKDMDSIVFETKIRQCSALNDCQMAQEPIYKWSPKCNGSKDMESLTQEVLKQIKKHKRKARTK